MEGTYLSIPIRYQYSFEDRTSSEVEWEYDTFYYNHGYYIEYELEPVEDEKYSMISSVYCSNSSEGKRIFLDKRNCLCCCISENTFYGITKESVFLVVDLETEERMEYKLYPNFRYIDFTVLDGVVYFNDATQLDLDTGERNEMKTKENIDSITEMYTDGENLYGICRTYNTENGITGDKVLQKIVFEE